MESEKIKEIKKDLECMSGLCKDRYTDICRNCKRDEKFTIDACKEVLTLINELESENEMLSKELNEEFAKRVNAERTLEHQQHHYKIGLTHSQTTNKKLKNRIAELEESNKKLKQSNKNILFVNDKVIERNQQLENRVKELEKENANKTDTITDLLKKQEFYETERLKQFAERLKNRGEIKALLELKIMPKLLKSIHDEIVKSIDETLKEMLGEE